MATPAEIEAQINKDKQFDELTKFVKKHICAQCEAPLVVRWWQGEHEVKCGQDKAHQGFKSWKESKRQLEKEAKQMVVDNKVTDLAEYSGKTALAEAEAKHIVLTLWPKAPEPEVIKAALLCRQYGLNPLMRHIYLVKYDIREKAKQVNGIWEKGKITGEEWSIQLGIGATRMIARRSGAYSYEDDSPRLMSEAEQIKILGDVDKTCYWAITKLRSKEGFIAQGYGNFPKDGSIKGMDKGNTPQNMAFIRSERAALDKLFPEKLPAGVETAPEYGIDITPPIDLATGEVLGNPDVSGQAKLAPSRPVGTPQAEAGVAEAAKAMGQQIGQPSVASGTAPSTISQARVDELSRLLTAKGFLPGPDRQEFYAKYRVERLETLTSKRANDMEAFLDTLPDKNYGTSNDDGFDPFEGNEGD